MKPHSPKYPMDKDLQEVNIINTIDQNISEALEEENLERTREKLEQAVRSNTTIQQDTDLS